ncbi:MAG: hypothetical protein BM563_00010 [Bacteroidetes bacterium MedPE-SWsnd-G1]|uniref:Uncharacterized protein n=1 Tax=Urechidicola vernalis TaxID=3075600 RepID=A0ABU2Y465_9FLAO|nr:hypothetical protein [Urechidicola sp. P050]MDT0552979.1 hypothetical protein [Urechidicola sp. P050]OIQ41735.1 MAG: hypothetical protein BM563_00010 [Bacteroidetes bacterium MedPE-SWsnd-G1]
METKINIKQKTTFRRALRLAKTAILFALILTPIRFSLELIGLPERIIFIIGLLWLTLAFAIYWGIKLYNEENALGVLLLSLLLFSPISRFPVAVIWWIDHKWEIGTHYSLHFDNFAQAAFQQVVYGSLIQLIPGFLLGTITIAIMRKKNNGIKKMNTIHNE